MKNGGYIIVSVADTNIYEKVNSALINGKPILFYDDTETAYYIDTIAKSGDNIILTKGGKTITITSANAVTETGEVQNHLYKYDFYILGTYEEETIEIFGKCTYPIAIDDVLDIDAITDDNRDVLNDLLKIMHLYDVQNDLQFGSPIYIYIDNTGFNLNCYTQGDNRITDIQDFYFKKTQLI